MDLRKAQLRLWITLIGSFREQRQSALDLFAAVDLFATSEQVRRDRQLRRGVAGLSSLFQQGQLTRMPGRLSQCAVHHHASEILADV